MLVSSLLLHVLVGCTGPVSVDRQDTPPDTSVDSEEPGDSAPDTSDTDDSDTDDTAAPGDDLDRDGHASLSSGGSDCDDADPRTFPGAEELCDAADRDCDGAPIGLGDCDALAEAEAGAWAAWYGNFDHSTGPMFGYDVAVAGDVDGDGWGEPFVMCWGCDALDGVPARIGGFFVLENPTAPLRDADYAAHVRASWIGDGFFYEMGGIAGAGDFDGDGWSDVAFTGDEYDAPGWLAIAYGPMSKWPARGRISDADAWWYTWSGQADSGFGNWALSSAVPDADGDGLDEIVVGRGHLFDDDGVGHGWIHGFYGGDWRGTVEADVADRGELRGATEGSLQSLTSAGDFDGDGFGDLLITHYATGTDGIMRRTHDVLDGYSVSDGITDTIEDHVQVSWSSLNSGGFNECLAGVGDWNGDGYADLVVGDDAVVENASTSRDDAPGVWFLAGRAAGQRSTDLREDAEGVLVDSDGDHVNRTGRCVGGGDIDGDAILDLVVTANRYEGYGVGLDNPDRREAVWLVPGRDGMPTGSVEWRERALGLAAHTTPENDSDAVSRLGFSLDVGDLTADGIDDVLIGDPEWGGAGAVFVIEGWPIDWELVRGR